MPLPLVRKLLPPASLPGAESAQELVGTPAVRVEHIVSRGEPSPPGFWYEQSDPEWVLLSTGRATLAFEDGQLELEAGDHLLIPAGCRHRVESCSVDATWLAVHVHA